MSDQNPIERAAREARKAAERARAFADLFEEYAACLLVSGERIHAAELRMLGKDKFAEIREALSDSEDWIRLAEWREEVMFASTSP